MQVQPAPRKAKGDGDEGGLSEYQRYVKENFARIKNEMEGAPVWEVMKKVGESFRLTKANVTQQNVDVGEGVPRQRAILERILAADEREKAQDEGDADDVVRKLDFLSLCE